MLSNIDITMSNKAKTALATLQVNAIEADNTDKIPSVTTYVINTHNGIISEIANYKTVVSNEIVDLTAPITHVQG